jgi:hypothetical protein
MPIKFKITRIVNPELKIKEIMPVKTYIKWIIIN